MFSTGAGANVESAAAFENKIFEMLGHSSEVMRDSGELIYADAATTKGEFSEDLAFVFDSANIPTSTRDDILGVLSKHLSKMVNLPVKETKKHEIKDTSSDYVTDDYRAMQVHICGGGCMVFIDDDVNLLRCSVCKRPRFTNCTHRDCKDKAYDDCTHAIRTRVPKKVVHYRPFIPLVRDLLMMPKFREALMYGEDKMANRSEVLTDVLDGEACRQAWDLMENHFQHQDPIRKEDYKDVKLLLGIFFDGANIFDRMNERFHALTVTLNNLHPSLRISDGLGMFLVAINTSFAQSSTVTVKGTAERLVFKLLFLTELKILDKGIFLNCYEHGKFFLQGQLVVQTYDTIEWHKITRTVGVGGGVDCAVCGAIHATYRKCLAKAVYGGHRALLPMQNILRRYGQSKACCPVGYHTGNVAVDDNICTIIKTAVTDKGTYSVFNPEDPARAPSASTGSCDLTADGVKLSVAEDKERFPHGVWFHENVYPWASCRFSDKLYYAHRDFRKMRTTDHVTHAEYIRRGGVALHTPGIACEGVYEPWVFEPLPSITYENVNWGAFHCLKNTSMNLLLILKGERGIGDKVKNMCLAERIHPSVSNVNGGTGKPSYILSEGMQNQLDALSNCIVVPTGYRDKNVILNPFRQRGFLSGSQVILFVTVYLPILLACLPTYDKEYRLFFSMFANDICDLMCPEITLDAIDNLIMRLTEIVALKEGLFPPSEELAIWHQLTDLAQHMAVLGPLRCTWEYPGEREMAVLKKMRPRGGSGFDIVIANRYGRHERTKVLATYSDNPPATGKVSRAKDALFMEGDNRIDFDSKSENFFELDDDEFENLLSSCIDYVKVTEQDECVLIKSSSLWRLHFCFLNNKESNGQTFSCWLKRFIETRGYGLELYDFNYDDAFLEFEIGMAKHRLASGVCSFDHAAVVDLLSARKIYACKKAVVLGVDMRARGDQYRNDPAKNDLKLTWSQRTQFSSWCMFEIQKLRLRGEISTTQKFGQINTFFRICCARDYYINGLAFANITSRTHTVEKKIHSIGISGIFSISPEDIPSNIFIPLRHFVSTKVGFLPLDNTGMPFETAVKQSTKLTKESSDCCSKHLPENLHSIIMIPLQPYRKGVTLTVDKGECLEYKWPAVLV